MDHHSVCIFWTHYCMLKSHSCINICAHKLFEAIVKLTRSNAQTVKTMFMEFMCCLNMVFTWKSSWLAKVCLHDVKLQNFAAWNEQFVCAFVDSNDVSGNDVRFCKLIPFYSTKFNILNATIYWLSGISGAIFKWNWVKCKINDHTCSLH